MATSEQAAASKLYADLISEVRLRISAVDTGTLNLIPVPPPLVREFCFLQFRMMCELLALGCLAAHGDLKGAKRSKLDGLWAADKIIEELNRLHPDFYPVAIIKTRTQEGFHIEPKSPQPLPKDELLKLYYRCGDVLHKGSTKKILSQKIPIQVHYPELTSVAQRFRDMITDHWIATLGGQLHFLCEVIEQGNEAKVNVAIAEAPPHK